jgi:hypothetical protein
MVTLGLYLPLFYTNNVFLGILACELLKGSSSSLSFQWPVKAGKESGTAGDGVIFILEATNRKGRAAPMKGTVLQREPLTCM